MASKKASTLTFTETTEVSFPTFIYKLHPNFKKKYAHTEKDWDDRTVWRWDREIPQKVMDSLAREIIDELRDVIFVYSTMTVTPSGATSCYEFKVPTHISWRANSLDPANLYPTLYYNVYVFNKPINGKPTFTEHKEQGSVGPCFSWDCCVTYSTFKQITRRYTDVKSKRVKDLLNSKYLR